MVTIPGFHTRKDLDCVSIIFWNSNMKTSLKWKISLIWPYKTFKSIQLNQKKDTKISWDYPFNKEWKNAWLTKSCWSITHRNVYYKGAPPYVLTVSSTGGLFSIATGIYWQESELIRRQLVEGGKGLKERWVSDQFSNWPLWRYCRWEPFSSQPFHTCISTVDFKRVHKLSILYDIYDITVQQITSSVL
jgi:hypothetical protein